MYSNVCDIVAVGECAVGGKTSLINRFLNGDPNKYVYTSHPYGTKELYLKEVDIKITMNLWDTAGQEKFRALNKFYYKFANAIILAYNLTSDNTFYEMKDYWYRATSEGCENAPSKL